MHFKWFWVIVAAVSMLACQRRDGLSHAHIDASALRAADVLAPGSRVTVVVSAIDFKEMVVLIDPNSLVASLDIPSGPHRRFEITVHSGPAEDSLTHYGRVELDLPSGADIDVKLPAFPGGVVEGMASTASGDALPSHVQVSLQAVQPRADAPVDFQATVDANGTFRQPLPAGIYQVACSASINGQTYSNSQTITVAAGAVSNVQLVLGAAGSVQLAFRTDPNDTAAGQAFAATVQVQDANQKLLLNPAQNITVQAINVATGISVLLGGTSTRPSVQGVVSFTDLSITSSGTYALQASAFGVAVVQSQNFTVAPGSLTTVRALLPTQAIAGQAFVAPVGGMDSYDNFVPSFSGSIDLRSSDSGAVFPATVAVAPGTGGVANANFMFTTAGVQSLTVQSGNLVGNSNLLVLAGAASALAFNPPPDGFTACHAVNFAVQLQDAYGNVVPDGNSMVQLSLSTHPAGTSLGGTAQTAMLAGVATFPDVQLNQPGSGYVLQASSIGLPVLRSAPFAVTAPPPVISNVQTSGSGGAINVTYNLQQDCSAASAVQIRLGVGGTLVHGVPGAGEGLQGRGVGNHTFVWDSLRDAGHVNTALVTLSLQAQSQGVTGSSVETTLAVHNALDTQTFAALVSGGASTTLQHLAAADMNHDGLLDLVGTSNASSSVVVLLQDAAGQFTALPPVGFAQPPNDVALGDFDRDGNMDAVVSFSTAPGTTQLLMGSPSGTLSPTAAATWPHVPMHLALADINNDGRLDLMASSNGNNFMYSSNANFTSALSVTTGATLTTDVAAADMNRDGKVDAVVTDSNNRVWVGINTGTSFSFAPYADAVGTAPNAVALGDLNGDGFVDVVLGHQSAATVAVLLGQSGGTLHAFSTFAMPAASLDVALGDVDGDGILDVVAPLSDGTLAAASGTGTGALNAAVVIAQDAVAVAKPALFNADGRYDVPLSTSTQLAGYLPNQQPVIPSLPVHAPAGLRATANVAMAAGDLNNDGRLDVVLVQGVQIQPYVSTGGGFYGAATPINNVGATNPVLVDVNGDGWADLLVVESTNLGVFLGHGDGTFAAVQQVAAGVDVARLTVGDVNGDGQVDAVVFYAGGAAVVLGNGHGAFGGPTALDLGSNVAVTDAALADITGDGALDAVVLSSSGSGSVLIAPGDGAGNFGAVGITAANPNHINLAIADFNEDTNLDVLTNNGSAGTVSFYAGHGATTLGSAQVRSVGPQGRGLAVGLITGDTHVDAVLGSPTTPSLALLMGNGNGTFNVGFADSLADTLTAAAADVDGDGFADAITFNANSLMTHTANRTSGFWAPTTYTLSNTPSDLALADMDRDGHLDVLIASSAGNAIAIRRGNGDGTLLNANTTTANQPSHLGVADFNNDGSLDVVTIVGNGNTLQYFPGTGSTTLGTSQNSIDFIESGATSLSVTDYNRDGLADVVVLYATPPAVAVCKGTGASTFSCANTTVTGSGILAVGDINHDDKADMLVAQANAVWPTVGDGNNTFTLPPSPITLASPPLAVTLGDLNHDGAADMVLTFASSVAIYLNQSGSFIAQGTYAVGSDPVDVHVADINGDGHADIIAACAGDNIVQILLGDGTGGISQNVQLGVELSPNRVALGDLNGDGRLDLVVSNAGSVSLSVMVSGP